MKNCLQITAKTALMVIAATVLISCSQTNENDVSRPQIPAKENASGNAASSAALNGKDDVKSLTDARGDTLETRILTPDGYIRVEAGDNTFASYLRSLPLKPDGSHVYYFDGRQKSRDVHAAVINMDTGDRDLQQCADAVIRLRAEYLYGTGQYDKIHFNFTSGFNAEYTKWMNGNRIRLDGNSAAWYKKTGFSDEYSVFREYLNVVFAYAGTLSLSKEMESIEAEDARPGDVFIKGGSPGHAVIILDMAENAAEGKKLFLLAQSYMPAQDIHVLKNPNDPELSPWYSADFGEVLVTPEWQFYSNQLMRFKD